MRRKLATLQLIHQPTTIMRKLYIYRQHRGECDNKPKPRQLVARFPYYCKREAMLTLETLQYVAFGRPEGNTYYNQFVYSMEEDPEPLSQRQAASERTDIQVDISAAIPTKRPITFEYSHRNEHDHSICLAFSKKYGTVRGVVPRSVEGRKLFIARITAVWPNAYIAP